MSLAYHSVPLTSRNGCLPIVLYPNARFIMVTNSARVILRSGSMLPFWSPRMTPQSRSFVSELSAQCAAAVSTGVTGPMTQTLSSMTNANSSLPILLNLAFLISVLSSLVNAGNRPTLTASPLLTENCLHQTSLFFVRQVHEFS